MSQPKKFLKKPSKLYRSLVTTLLIANGIFQLIVPALAEGTKAGESISNTATATYEDPLDPGTKINTTSNTVVVTVAEVAGITVTASGVTDCTPATPVSVGDTVNYTYTITNVGNDATKFRVPAFNNFPTKNTSGLPSGDRGIIWQYNRATESLTNISDGDTAEYLSPGIDPTIKYPGIKCDGSNTNGAIVVKLGNLPNATAPGIPASSYGFIRFRGRVK